MVEIAARRLGWSRAATGDRPATCRSREIESRSAQEQRWKADSFFAGGAPAVERAKKSDRSRSTEKDRPARRRSIAPAGRPKSLAERNFNVVSVFLPYGVAHVRLAFGATMLVLSTTSTGTRCVSACLCHGVLIPLAIVLLV